MHYEFGPEQTADFNLTVQLGRHPQAIKALVTLSNADFEFHGSGVSLHAVNPSEAQMICAEQSALAMGLKEALDDYTEWLAIGTDEPTDEELYAIEDEVRDIFANAGLSFAAQA